MTEHLDITHLHGLDNLIGQKINSVTVSADDEQVIFETDNHKYIYVAAEDCCSHSWIEAIEDVENIIGQKVIKIEENEVNREEDHQQCETLDIANYDIYTERGICRINFRNSSNGYYGGHLELEEIIIKDKK